MFKHMLLFLIVLANLIHAAANAKTRIEDGSNKKIFIANGKIVSVLEAGEAAKDGKDVLICDRADYVCNEKTGKCGPAKAK